jgi:S-adenosylmethionine-diacylglycerol 3-amino-3-carboxypropyl transferase
MKRIRAKQSYFSKISNINKIDFYTCWDDFQLIQEALDINNNDIIFLITSGGCNALNSLLYNPKKILAVDYNPYQNYLLELKIEAIKNLNYSEFLQFMGLTPSSSKIEIYTTIREKLSKNAREFWDSNYFVINKGILNFGEQNVKRFGKILRFLKGKNIIEKFFSCNTINKQRSYFYKYIYGFSWKLLLNYTYNKVICKLALCLIALHEIPYRRERLSGYLRYIQKMSYPKNHLEKIENIFTKIPIKDNNFASLMLLGRYIHEECYPPYLKRKNYNILKKRVDRIELKTAAVEETLKELSNNSFTKFSMSNIFDWISDDEFKNILNQIIRVGKNKGRLFYSTTRNDRDIPKNIKDICSEKKFANKLFQKDRTMLYSNFVVVKICK